MFGEDSANIEPVILSLGDASATLIGAWWVNSPLAR